MWRDPPRPASLCGLWGHRLAGGCDKARENLSLVSRTQCFPTASGKGVDEQTEGHKDLGSVREVAVHGEQGEGGSGRRKGLPTAGERGPHSEKVSHLASKIRKTERGRSDKGTRCCLPRARRLGRWGGGDRTSMEPSSPTPILGVWGRITSVKRVMNGPSQEAQGAGMPADPGSWRPWQLCVPKPPVTPFAIPLCSGPEADGPQWAGRPLCQAAPASRSQ